MMKMVPLFQLNSKARLRKANWADYQYHQNEVLKDPHLLKWVLQEDYWDCQPREFGNLDCKCEYRLISQFMEENRKVISKEVLMKLSGKEFLNPVKRIIKRVPGVHRLLNLKGKIIQKI